MALFSNCPRETLAYVSEFLQKLQQNSLFRFSEQNKSKEMSSSNSTTPVKTDPEQTSISLNDTESIRKQEPKKQVNIVISYIEQNDEQGIGQLVKPSLSLRTCCTVSRLVEGPFLVYSLFSTELQVLREQ